MMMRPFRKNYISGLKISPNVANPESKIDIAIGQCRCDMDACNFVSNSILTVDITTSGANGLDTGSEAASTWYYIYLVYKQSTDTYAGLLSISSTSPTMPSEYDMKRRIGSVYNNSVSLLNPYAHYKLNESSGTNVADSSGNGRDGDTQNMDDSNWVSGKLNNCLQFTVSNEYVNCGNIAGFERTDPFSFEMWFKTSTDGKILLSKRLASSPNPGYQIIMSSGKIVFLLLATSTSYIQARSATGSLNDNAWHHLVVTYSGSSTASGVNMYIDNNDESLTILSDTLSTGSTQNSVACQISGRNGANLCFDGLIDEVIIYSQELSASNVSFRWNSGSGTESMQDNSTAFKNFSCQGTNNTRIYTYHEPRSISRVLSGGGATIFTDVILSSAVPVTSENTKLYVRTSVAKKAFVRPDGCEYSNPNISLPAIVDYVMVQDCSCPGQKIEYQTESGGDVDIDVIEYTEEL